MRAIFVLTGLLLIGWSAAIIAAGIDIESIVVTGPIAGIVGVLMAFVFAYMSWRVLTVASLTLPLVGLLVFLLIFCNRWSPEQAQRPVMVVLLGYELLAASLWLGGMWSVVYGSPQLKFQFPLRSLMIVTLIVAVALGAGRLALTQSPAVLLAVAVGLFVAVTGGLVWMGIAALLTDSPRPGSPSPA